MLFPVTIEPERLALLTNLGVLCCLHPRRRMGCASLDSSCGMGKLDGGGGGLTGLAYRYGVPFEDRNDYSINSLDLNLDTTSTEP